MIGGAKGIGIGIDFGIPNQYCRATSKPYIEKDVLDSLRVVASAYGKSNNDADRSIVKNLVDASNPFVISNAAYEGMSGYNGYPIILSGTNSTYQDKASYTNIVGDDKNIINITRISFNTAAIFSYIKQNGTLTDYNRNIESFKVKVTGIDYSKFVIKYSYISGTNATERTVISITSDGTYELPKSFASDGSLTSDNVWIGLNFTKQSTDIPDIIEDVNVTIEVLPEFEGAFVTDGIDDLITSTKTVQEMLGGSNEITVVSMAHFIKGESNAPEICRINQIRRDTRSIRNSISKIGKSGIFGYTYKNGVTTINNILGDKNDCTAEGNLDGIVAPFSVEGYYYNNNSNPLELCSIAWYWTIIANKVLITDQINQVIAYFNLDRTLKPDILCNVKKQGITNENHAEFGDRLIDFSGNGRYIQLNNLAWDGDSGIGKYNYPNWKVNVTQGNKYARIVYYDSINGTYSANFKGITDLYKSYGLSIEIRVNRANTVDFHSIKEDGIYTMTPPDDTTSIDIRFGGENVYNASCDITITKIPSHAGALLLDGVDDFGKVTGMPVYKDYTVVTDREIFANTGAISSKNNPGAFVETAGYSVYSFGQATSGLNFISTRSISYLSKYSYCGQSITAGAAEDGTDMWLGTIRDNDTRFFNGAIYSLMTFPYSMSEFLIERQLKKHKLGTLYPDMVEWRPIIKSNVEYASISYLLRIPGQGTVTPVIGQYYPILSTDTSLVVYVATNGVDEVANLTINGQEPTSSSIHVDGRFKFEFPFNNSPQKINITIDEYIRYEDIVQPYPVLLRFNDENGNEVSWGGKLRVGSTITRIGSAADSNLLPNIYNIFGLLLNGNQVTSSKVIVEKTMVFKAKSAYIFDNNEPKCILSPSRLRIPNSSYKLLGYIPDISGHGNHGKINNSVYAGMSGVNGYPVVFGANKTWANESNGYVTSITSNTIHITNVLNAGLALLYSYVKYNGNLQNIKEIPPFKIEIKGLEGRSKFIYKYLATSDATKGTNLYLGNGTHELPKSFLPTEALINNAVVGFSISPIEEGVTNFLSDITIKVLPEYEGAYCLDGVDDFVTIPTTVGGKQMLMKVNWDKTIADAILYDQRRYPNEFAIYNADNDNSGNPVFAYQARNNGQTYIDGILNKNIKASKLRAITHNITITNELQAGVNKSYAVIGSNRANDAYFTKMALYDFMLFDEISTDDKIKELNEYVGIEGNT